MVVLAAGLARLLVGLHEVLLRDGEEAGVLGAGDELAGAAHRVERVIGRGRGRLRLDHRGQGTGLRIGLGLGVGAVAIAGGGEHLVGLGRAARGSCGEGALGRGVGGLLLLGELVARVCNGVREGVSRLAEPVLGHVGLPEQRVDGTDALAGGEIQGGAVGVHSVVGAGELHEAVAELHERRGGLGVALVDGGGAPGARGLGDHALLGVDVGEGDVGLVGRGVARVGDGGLEAGSGGVALAGGHEGAASVAVERADVGVGGVGEGQAVGLGGLGEVAELHEGVAAQVVGLAVKLTGGLGGRKADGGGAPVTGLVGGLCDVERLCIQVNPLSPYAS